VTQLVTQEVPAQKFELIGAYPLEGFAAEGIEMATWI
jgi:hypothetical protein